MSGKHRRQRILFINHWARSLGGAEYSLMDILRTVDNKMHFCLVTAEYGDLHEQVKNTRARRLVLECSNDLLLIKRDRLLLGLLRQWRAVVHFLVFLIVLCTKPLILTNVSKTSLLENIGNLRKRYNIS